MICSVKEPDLNSLPTKQFFNEYRTGLGHPGFRKGQKPPMWASPEDWRNSRSSKWKMVSILCRMILLDVDSPNLPHLVDGELEGLHILEGPLHGDAKILLYMDFTAPIEHLASGLRFDGFDVVVVTGRNSDLQRSSTISDFSTNPRRQILIMSSVGNAGLNLQCVNHVIFMDMQWSDQARTQIIGRAWRQGQKRQVSVWSPVVTGTSDEHMAYVGFDKQELLSIFLNEDDKVRTNEENAKQAHADEHAEQEQDNAEEAAEKETGGSKSKKKATSRPDTPTSEATSSTVKRPPNSMIRKRMDH
ncbi:hypothetical protein SCHPADRAFT_989961 [Schizopora paradoxa]|uniref:Helicase C-terminal domain-containing protein n=1 Tax=Schizopora paradoxa TaxID=27342 RepID=A0A0H2RH18_9AGAM|nr:hypothetical protein SCHPADRAFT_989961 [Schizopora paradoxa]